MAQPNGTTQGIHLLIISSSYLLIYSNLTYLLNSISDDRVIVWFDIDNTLYSASSKIADAMGQRIHNYFTGLGLEEEEASVMHLKYYKTYGLCFQSVPGTNQLCI